MRYTDFLRWGILGGFCLLMFVPFIIAQGGLFPNMFFPFITGKNFAFRILVEVMLGLYILLALREPKYRPQGSYLMWALVAFVVWVGLATVLSVDPLKSFWSNFERMEGYVSLLHMFALCVIAGAVITVEKWWDVLFKVSVTASVIMSIDALLQVFNLFGFLPSTQSGPRADATFGNATYLAVYMLFNFFITLYLALKSRSPNAWAVYGLVLLMQFSSLFFTQTRGTLLGAVGGILVAAVWVAWQAREPRFRVLRKGAIGGLIVLVILGGSFMLLRDSALVKSSETLSRLASISFEDRTTRSRFMIWNMAYEGFKEKPLIGWGQENFSYVFNANYNPAMYDQEQWFDRAHNQFLDWLLAAGLPAFLLFLSFFLLGAWALYRSELEVPAQAAILGLLAGYGFHSLFVFDNLISAMYLFLLLAFLHSLTPRSVPRFMFLSRPMSEHGVAIAAPVVLVCTIAALWFVNVPALTRAKSLIDSITTTTQSVQNGSIVNGMRDPKENLASFEHTLELGYLGKQEVVEQLYAFAGNLAVNSSASPEVKEEAYALARQEGEAMLTLRPNDARMELFLANFLNQNGRYQEGLVHFERALELSPQKQQILFQIGLTKITLGDEEGALRYFKQAYESEPSYDEALILYAIGHIYAGNRAEADRLLTERFGTYLVDNQRMLQVYTGLKMYDRVIGVWQKKVENNPTDAQMRVNLASAYFAAGNNPKTIEELRKAGEIEPSLKAQVDALISQIQNGTLVPNQ